MYCELIHNRASNNRWQASKTFKKKHVSTVFFTCSTIYSIIWGLYTPAYVDKNPKYVQPNSICHFHDNQENREIHFNSDAENAIKR